MERNPLIVVSSRLDGVRDEARGSKKSAPSIVTAWRRAKEADVGNTIVDCHDESLADEVKGAVGRVPVAQVGLHQSLAVIAAPAFGAIRNKSFWTVRTGQPAPQPSE